MATSTLDFRKCSNAKKVVISKKVAGMEPASTISKIASMPFTTSSSEINALLTHILSRNEERWGEVYSPTRYPENSNAFAILVATEPLPLLPATWIQG